MVLMLSPGGGCCSTSFLYCFRGVSDSFDLPTDEAVPLQITIDTIYLLTITKLSTENLFDFELTNDGNPIWTNAGWDSTTIACHSFEVSETQSSNFNIGTSSCSFYCDLPNLCVPIGVDQPPFISAHNTTSFTPATYMETIPFAVGTRVSGFTRSSFELAAGERSAINHGSSIGVVYLPNDPSGSFETLGSVGAEARFSTVVGRITPRVTTTAGFGFGQDFNEDTSDFSQTEDQEIFSAVRGSFSMTLTAEIVSETPDADGRYDVSIKGTSSYDFAGLSTSNRLIEISHSSSVDRVLKSETKCLRLGGFVPQSVVNRIGTGTGPLPVDDHSSWWQSG